MIDITRYHKVIQSQIVLGSLTLAPRDSKEVLTYKEYNEIVDKMPSTVAKESPTDVCEAFFNTDAAIYN